MSSDPRYFSKHLDWLFRWLMPPEADDTALGDYKELYAKQVQYHGRGGARRWLFRQGLRAVGPLLVHRFKMEGRGLISAGKLAYRNARKRPFYSLVNVLGLAVGMAVFGLVGLYVRHELSYDRHHANANRIYRVDFTGVFGGKVYETACVAAVTVTALRSDFPEVEAATRVYAKPEPVFRQEDKVFQETRFAYVDSSFFRVFTVPLLSGDPRTALAEPNSLVLSTDMAMKYFGRPDPLGQRLQMEGGGDYQITGVFEPMPETGHFRFDLMGSLCSLDESENPLWLDNMLFPTYCLLREGADPASLEAKFPGMVDRYIGAMYAKFGRSLEAVREAGNDFAYTLQPLTAIHLHSHRLEEIAINGDARTVAIFSVIAFFVLLIACVNFMNLATARSLSRSREVGVRKAMGGKRSELRAQFLSEALAISGLALILAVVLIGVALPYFRSLSGRDVNISSLIDPMIILGGLVLWVFVALVSGSYPAFFLASLQPVAVLRQRVSVRSSARGLRNGLVVLQFLLSVVLVAGALVAQSQWRFIRNKDLGYDRSQLLYIENGTALGQSAAAFKARLLTLPEVESVAFSFRLPTGDNKFVDVMCPEGRYREEGTPISRWDVDADFLETYGMALVSGRFFDPERNNSPYDIVVNESAVQFFGWDQPLGKRIFDGSPPNMETYTVVGVVKDFHYESMRSPIAPLALMWGDEADFITVRLAPGRIRQGVEAVRKVWQEMAPSRYFSYGFVDDRFEATYFNERREGGLFTLFAGLALFIGALGLLGLVAFAAEQRTKEIGIRKVLGASVSSVVLLLGREFGRLVLAAFILGAPLAYWLMRRWLEGFSYRISLGPWPFVWAGIAVAGAALTTVFFLAFRAAMENPVWAIRAEQ